MLTTIRACYVSHALPDCSSTCSDRSSSQDLLRGSKGLQLPGKLQRMRMAAAGSVNLTESPTAAQKNQLQLLLADHCQGAVK